MIIVLACFYACQLDFFEPVSNGQVDGRHGIARLMRPRGRG